MAAWLERKLECSENLGHWLVDGCHPYLTYHACLQRNLISMWDLQGKNAALQFIQPLPSAAIKRVYRSIPAATGADAVGADDKKILGISVFTWYGFSGELVTSYVCIA